MPRSSWPTFERFVRALQRNYTIARGIERIGWALLFSCVAAGMILPVLWWQSQPALPVISILLGLGFMTGLLAAYIRRPTKLAAVMEADRQLQLDDLLSTALTVARRNDSWAALVVSLAETRCANLSPGRVIFHRWGGRAWGGVGLATALVLSLAGMLNQPSALVAGVDKPVDVFGSASQRDRTRQPPPSVAYQVRVPTPPRSAVSDSTLNGAENPTAIEPSTATSSTPSQPPSNPNSSTAQGGAGSGSSQTTAKPTASTPQAPSASQTTPHANDLATRAGTGIGTADTPADKTASSSTGVVSEKTAGPTEPWSPTGQDATNRQRAWQDRVRAQPQLDAYRDLIERFYSSD